MPTRLALALAAVFLLWSAAPAHSKGSKSALKVVNESDCEIHHLFLSTVDDADWGPDQLIGDVFEARGGKLTLYGVSCGRWDIRIVDADGDTCVIEDVDLCKGEGGWKLTNKHIARCQGWGR